jgi:hypothetical protein
MKPSCIIITVLIILGYIEIASAIHLSSAVQMPYVISWFFVAKGSAELPLQASELASIIGTPGAAEIALLRQREMAHKVAGLIVFYAGRIAYSDFNGQVMLPLLEPTDELMIFVTERPSPKILHGNTVEVWNVKPGYRHECFSLKRIEQEKSFMWQIERVVPSPREIPYHAIVVCIDPEVIEVPVGKWPTVGGINLILPNIYITGVVPESISALNTIAISRFFRPTHRWFSYAPERYVTVTT